MERDREGRPAAYLGDGAYVAFDGFGLELYTDDGMRIQNRVVLEPQAIGELVRFMKAHGFSPFLLERGLVKP